MQILLGSWLPCIASTGQYRPFSSKQHINHTNTILNQYQYQRIPTLKKMRLISSTRAPNWCKRPPKREQTYCFGIKLHNWYASQHLGAGTWSWTDNFSVNIGALLPAGTAAGVKRNGASRNCELSHDLRSCDHMMTSFSKLHSCKESILMIIMHHHASSSSSSPVQLVRVCIIAPAPLHPPVMDQPRTVLYCTVLSLLHCTIICNALLICFVFTQTTFDCGAAADLMMICADPRVNSIRWVLHNYTIAWLHKPRMFCNVQLHIQGVPKKWCIAISNSPVVLDVQIF